MADEKRRLLRSEKSATFSPKFKYLRKDSLKLSSKIKLIVKSLCWLVCSFYLNFKIIIKRSGLHVIAHSLTIVVEIVATRWLRHLADLGVKLTQLGQDPHNLVLYHHFTVFITSLLYLHVARK